MSFPRYERYKDSGMEWLGEVPAHWEINTLKRQIKMRYGDALASEIREDGEIEVFGSNGPIGLHCVGNTKAPAIVVGRKGSYGKIIWSEKGGFVIDTAYAIDSNATALNLRWVYYGLQLLGLDSLSQDTGVPGLARENAYEMRITVPPILEQQTIAAFLDRETAKIDALIAEQQQLIVLLKEKRLAVISHAVIKGLNPNAPMKDSGIKWLGEVPEHWEVKPIKYVIDKIESGTSVNSTDEPTDDYGVGVLKTSCVYSGVFNPLENKTVVEQEMGRVSCPLRVDTLIVSRMNTPELVGAAGLVTDAPNNLYLPDRLWQISFSNAQSAFVYYWTQSTVYRAFIKITCSGTSSSMQNLGQDQFRSFMLPMPNLEEQTIISTFLNCETAKLDTLTAEARRAIELLKERRTALISAAVTGKIDVRPFHP